MKKKLSIVVSLLAVFFTQTGFIAGIATVNPPLIAVGAVGTIACGCMSYGCFKNSNPNAYTCDTEGKCGWTSTLWAGLCLALGHDNTDSHAASLGPFPESGKSGRKFSVGLGVELKDVEQYNRELGRISDLYEIISQSLGQIMKDHSWDGEKDSFLALEDSLSQDARLQKFAAEFGFANLDEVLQIFKNNEITSGAVARFSSATHITSGMARILLQKAFLLKIVDGQAIQVKSRP